MRPARGAKPVTRPRPPAGPRLRRSLGLVETTIGGVGIILGAGIYALIGEAAGRAGNAVWLSFLLAGVMATFTGLSYAEMSSAYPKAGADYEYTRHAFGRWPAVLVGLVIITGNVIAAAAVSLGFGGYFRVFVDVATPLPAILGLAVAAAIALYGIRQSLWVAMALTVVEFAGLLVVIAVGVPHLGDNDLLDAPRGISGVFSGAALVMFAFIGFEQVATLSEETRDARNVVPKALLLSIAITAVVYVAVALAAVSVIDSQPLSDSSAPLSDVVGSALGGRSSDVLAVVALFSTFNTMLLLLVAASRLIYGMADTGSLPAVLAWVQPRFRTPALAIALALAASSALAFSGDIGLIAESANFAIFLGFAAVNASLIALRFTQPAIQRPFRTPLNAGRLPLLPIAALASIGFMIANLDSGAILIGLGLIAASTLASSMWSVTHH